jgi:DNA mismatch repair protein MutS
MAGLAGQLDPLDDLRTRIQDAISDEAPANLSTPGIIRSGYNPELDELRTLRSHGQQYIADMESRERDRTGIASLKVRFNNVFGYYIEVSKPGQRRALHHAGTQRVRAQSAQRGRKDANAGATIV